MKWAKSLVMVMCIISCCGVLHAEIYRTVDKNGNVVFTDRPTKNSSRMQLPPLTIISSPQGNTNTSDTHSINNIQQSQIYYKVKIMSPINGQTYTKGNDIPVQVKAEPEPQNGDQLIVSVNGRNTNANSINTDDMDRGEYTLNAKVINASGKVVSNEISSTYYLFQNSTLFRKH